MSKRWIVIFITLAVLLLSFVMCQKKGAQDFDILITNGMIVDGSGNNAYEGDIGIIGDTIVEIGDLAGKTAIKTIDAEELVVSPGFIDIHTHCAEALGEVDANVNLNYLIQGTTTVQTGPDGEGAFKIAEIKAKWENQGIGTNVIPLVGFGVARKKVMGVEPRKASSKEIEEMKEIIRQAMREGAWGMSIGLEYIPDRYATTEEIIAVTKVVGEFDGIYHTHQRNEFDGVLEATRETVRIGKETGVRMHTTHFKACGKNNWGTLKDAADTINEARTNGIQMTADIYPYEYPSGGPLISISKNAGWSCFRLPNDMEPFARLRKKMRDENLSNAEMDLLKKMYIEELAKALSDKSKREQIKKSVLEGTPHDPSPLAISGWDSYGIVAAKKNTHLIGKIISDLAAEQNKDAFDIVADLVIDEPDIYTSCGVLSENDMRHVMKYDWLMFASDGYAVPIVKKTDTPTTAHPRAFGSQARVLRKYVKEEKELTLENAIRKMTSIPADLLRMKDRGLLKKGYKADVAVFNPETIRDNATFADARQYSTGTEYVIVNGKVSIENGEYDGALNGKVLLLTESK
jgi:N-acyl-D-aspartate/D-glutamate deacylase